MKLVPLVLHASMFLPRYTALFSDRLSASSLSVVSGGKTTITCSKPHGVPVGNRIAVSITDALIPNPITDFEILANGDISLTTSFEHDLTTTPDEERFQAWHLTATLSSFENSLINGNRQLVSAPDRNTFVIRPGGTVGSITLTGDETLLERLDGEVVGWHAVRAESSTTLTFATPETVARTYTVDNPTIVTSIRVYGALDYEAAIAQLTQDGDLQTIDRGHIFITPLPNVRTDRSRSSKTGAVGEQSPGTEFRQLLLDGFHVVAFLPSAGGTAHVKAIDMAHGELLKAVLRTFQGLKIERAELVNAGSYTAVLEGFGGALTKSRAIYAHEWRFAVPAWITSDDAISPWQWPVIDDEALMGGETPVSVMPVGTGVFRDIDFGGVLETGKPGIIHDGMPGNLEGVFSLDNT